MAERLISADSHVRITADSVRERLSAKVAAQYDDALKALAAEEDELRGGQSFGLGSFDLEGARDLGYWEPNARLAAMDRDGVEAEVLYSELSAFRQFHLIPDDWKAVARAFNDLAITELVDPTVRYFYGRPFRVLHSSRFVDACMAKTPLSRLGYTGSIDQFVDSTDVLSKPAVAQLLRDFIVRDDAS